MRGKVLSLNMKVKIRYMFESHLSISAAAQLLPVVDYADLDNPLLIKNDMAHSIDYQNDKFVISAKPEL